MTVGKLWYNTVDHAIRVLLRLQSPKTIQYSLKMHLTMNIIATYLSVTPFANLIGFIIIPAHQQIVFKAGAELVAGIFFATLVRVFATWAVKTDFMQRIMANVTANAMKSEGYQENLARIRYGDEL
ncbi:uncharacterized protein K460DRAFT_405367 [Cucurbitaria berberidis CBS 394.84]|uniref:Uncharacterized protein n=1 Tax=Cucurbitaria berberidis CBS 394.84 TaxID=1168544 RepID=A0A9P4L889_9PLEO|nr:uncharacterized protein K460DRAFT_405367 [Cucurbitaria berberidis CBS 394.84]KAF1845092.1 hypothetical protein K460DRAFT_405367 [Cucurbitaria berberidis CBS 394.84]